MSRVNKTGSLAVPTDTQFEQATQWFLRVRSDSARVEDLSDFKEWIDSDPQNNSVYEQVAASWAMLSQFSSSPEIMKGRRDALDDARRAARRRWSMRTGTVRLAAVAASVMVAVIGAAAWLYSQRSVHATDLGERHLFRAPGFHHCGGQAASIMAAPAFVLPIVPQISYRIDPRLPVGRS